MSRLFSSKKRSFDQPILLKWIEIFTIELPKPEDQQNSNPLFGYLLQQIPAKVYTTESIYNINNDEEYKVDQFDQRNFLITKFELDQQIDKHYWELIPLVINHKSDLSSNPKIWKQLYPYLMRFFIHYNYQFCINEENFFKNPTEDNELFQNVKHIIPLIYIYSQSKDDIKEICSCLKDFITDIQRYLCTPNNFFHNQILRKISDEIFASCHGILAQITNISSRYSLPVYLAFLYFNSYCTIFGIKDISNYEIGFLINALSIVPKIDHSIFMKQPNTLLTPLIDGSLRILNVLSNYRIPETLIRQSFCLGVSIIDKFTHLFKMNIGKDLSFQKQLSKGIKDFAYFILWCLDKFPLDSPQSNDHFPFNPKFHNLKFMLILADVYADTKFSELPDYNFIETPTFSEPIQPFSIGNEENLIGSYAIRQKNSAGLHFPEAIRNRPKLYNLAVRVVVFMHALAKQNINLLGSFVEVALDVINQLLPDNNGKLRKINSSFIETVKRSSEINRDIFDIKGNNLPLSYYFFMISVFNNCNENLICKVFSMIPDGFSILIHKSIFSPFINKWVAEQKESILVDRKDGQKDRKLSSKAMNLSDNEQSSFFDESSFSKDNSEASFNSDDLPNEKSLASVEDSKLSNSYNTEDLSDEKSNTEDSKLSKSYNTEDLSDEKSNTEDSKLSKSDNIDDLSDEKSNTEDSKLNKSDNTDDISNEKSNTEDSKLSKSDNNEDLSDEKSNTEDRKLSQIILDDKENNESSECSTSNAEIDAMLLFHKEDSTQSDADKQSSEDQKPKEAPNSESIQSASLPSENASDKSEVDNTPPITTENALEIAEQNRSYFDLVFEIRSLLFQFLSTCFHVSSSSSSVRENALNGPSTPSSKKPKRRPGMTRSQSLQLLHTIVSSPTSSKGNIRIDDNSSFTDIVEIDLISKDVLEYSFDYQFDKERCCFYMMSSLYALFIDASPQIFDEIIPLVLDFITEPDFFIKASNKTGIFEMIMKHMLDLQILHICLQKEENAKYKKFIPNMESSRLGVFQIFDKFLRTNGGKLFIFGSQQFVQYLFHFLFEPSVMYFTSDLIKRCVMLNRESISINSSNDQFKIIFRNISELIKTSFDHLSDFRWIQLFLVLFDSLMDSFAINRNSIFTYLRSQQVLLLLSRLPSEVVRLNPTHFILFEDNEDKSDEYTDLKSDFKISEEDKPYMRIFEIVFDIFIHLSRENATFSEALSSSNDAYYDNITTGMKLIIFGTSMVDRLLSLVFEQPLSIKKLPATAQIRNYFALPFLFNSTTHLSYHSILMHFLTEVCKDSVSNKLRVFQAHLPEIIIDYLQQFPSRNEIRKNVNESIAVSLRLFSIVSQYVFSVPTLFRCIQAMRTKDGMRVWWTGQLLSLFSTYIENSAQSSPCAFFYLDGRHTGFFLPEISQLTFSKGWSFMCRFELDSFGSSNVGGNLSPVLLYMQFKNGDSFSISFTNAPKKAENNSGKYSSPPPITRRNGNVKALKITYKNHNNSPNGNNNWSEVIDSFEIHSNMWYDLIFSSDFNLYISTSSNKTISNNQYFSLSLKNTKKADLKQGVQTASIGNTPPLVASEAPLVANISSFYFFTGTMNSKTVELLLSLPLSFVFGFSPSERKIDPRLPERLFNDAFDSRLFLGINARKTDGSTCFNIAKKGDIPSCTFRGVAFPFSTSFIDIINYSGGLKLFLPLFEQVNLSMYKEEDINDNSIFFSYLISMIQSFFQHSKALEADFVRYDGFKAMSYSLMKINPQHYIRSILNSLLVMCAVLEPEFRSIMIDEIWLNFNIWKKLSIEIQNYLYERIFNELQRSENFRDHIQIGELCAIISEQPSEELRRHLWNLLVSMASISFSPDEQDSLFSFLFLKENISFQLEALQCFYELCVWNINDICSVFQRKGMYLPFLQLLESEEEKVRMIALKIIFIIYHFNKSNSLLPSANTNYNQTLSLTDQFDYIMLTAVHQLIVHPNLKIQMIDVDEPSNKQTENFTQETWKTLMLIALTNSENSSDLRFTIPIVCSCSHFFDSKLLVEFQSKLISLFDSNLSIAKNITDCSCWYFWLLYFSIQKAQNKYVFSDRQSDAVIFGKIFEYMAQTDVIDGPVFFFNWICYTRGWNTMALLNLIFCQCISSIKKCHFTKFINIVFEVFIFLFYIKNNEKYSYNVQLHSQHSQKIENSLLDEIDASISLEEYINIPKSTKENVNSQPSEPSNDYVPPPSDYFTFSMRITEEGNWIDLDLAKVLIAFISYYSEKSGVTTMSFSKIPKTKLAEIFAFLIYSVVRVDPKLETIKMILHCIKQFFSPKSVDTLSFKIITLAFAKVSITEETVRTTLNEFYQQNSAMMNNLNADFNDPQFLKNVIQDYSLDLSSWLEILQGFTINVLDLYKQRYSLYAPQIISTINLVKKSFVNRVYTKELDDNCIALKRKQRRNRSLAAKIFRRFQLAMTVNGGPWCDNKSQNHWKLAPRTDIHMRHLFVRPNWHFDNHKVASLRRDKSKNEQAKLEYQMWIENQDLNLGSAEFSIEDALDKQQEAQQQALQPPTKSQYQFSATMITIAAVYDGNFSLNRSEICFDGVQAKDEYLFSIEGHSSKTVEFKLSEIVWILHRSYLHIDRGLEFFCSDGRSYFFYFSLPDRNHILKILSDYRPPNLMVLQRTSSQRCFNEQRFTEKWLNKEMSTYDYLMTVNFFAGRSFNDLSQYPVFPWILADYKSENIDVDANPPPPGLFRDLSKPIGALNDKRLSKLKRELEILRESNDDINMNSSSCLNESPCLYRCHYSTAYYVLLYMIRLEPFTTMHILMQDDKFDHPDRLFSGIEKAWNNVSSTTNDFRELIPEFFSLPDFLVNKDNFDLGLSEKEGNNVILPKWAKDPYWFIAINRKALESEYVAQNIGYWIDLIFGCKQNGQAAIDADNTFHAYCYPSVINAPEVTANHELLYEVQKHAGSFGIIPRQLFTSPHPNFPSAQQNNENGPNEQLVQSNLNNRVNSGKATFPVSAAYKADSNILNISVSNHLFYVTSEAKLFRLKPKQFLFESSTQIPFGVGKCSVIFAKLKLLVVTSPSGDAFHTFSLDSNTNLTHIFSFRQQFSSLTSIVGVNESILVVLSQDGSLTVWDFNSMFTKIPKQNNYVLPSSPSLTNINMNTNGATNSLSPNAPLSSSSSLNNLQQKRNKVYNNVSDIVGALFTSKEEFVYLPFDRDLINNNSNATGNSFYSGTSQTPINSNVDNGISYNPVYKVNHHLVSAVCVTASGALRLIASCDISRRIVLTELIDGSFIRSFTIPDESAVPVSILILDAGYISTICEHCSHNDVRSTIQIYALDSSMLAIYDHPRRVSASCAINLVNGSSFIAVGFEDGNFVIIRSPDASLVHTMLFPSPIVSIYQKDNKKLLYLANAEKQIFSLVLDL